MKYLNEDQELMLASIKEFVRNEIEPRVLEEMEIGNKCPLDLFDRARELGISNMMLPEEYGGIGESMVMHVAVVEEFAKVNLALSIACPQNMIAAMMLRVGTPEQKEAYMDELVNKGAGFSFTEPCAGSDASGIQSTAVLDGDEWVINGQKTWISFMTASEWTLCSAKTEHGVSSFLLNTNSPGVTKSKPFHKLGMHGSDTGELFLDNVRVPKIALIGKEGKGLHNVLGVLDEARLAVAAAAVGLAQEALDKAVAYSKERVAFGRPIASFQGLQWYAAEMATKISAARALVYEAAQEYDAGLPFGVTAAKAKFFAANMAQEVTNKAVQMCGGMGLMDDFGMERFYRDAKVCSITEGTDEILKLVVARDVFA